MFKSSTPIQAQTLPYACAQMKFYGVWPPYLNHLLQFTHKPSPTHVHK